MGAITPLRLLTDANPATSTGLLYARSAQNRSGRNSGRIFGGGGVPGSHQPGLAVRPRVRLLVSIKALVTILAQRQVLVKASCLGYTLPDGFLSPRPDARVVRLHFHPLALAGA